MSFYDVIRALSLYDVIRQTFSHRGGSPWCRHDQAVAVIDLCMVSRIQQIFQWRCTSLIISGPPKAPMERCLPLPSSNQKASSLLALHLRATCFTARVLLWLNCLDWKVLLSPIGFSVSQWLHISWLIPWRVVSQFVKVLGASQVYCSRDSKP